MSRREVYFQQKVQEIPSGVTPGFVLQAYHKGTLALDIAHGEHWKYYDLASLTKIIFTVSWAMKAVDSGRVRLSQKASDFLPWARQKGTVLQLLNHTAGNSWWQPFYKNIPLDESAENKKWHLKKMVSEVPLSKNPKAVYSDIDFFCLGFLLESVFEKDWYSLWSEFQNDILAVEDLWLQPENKMRKNKNEYAPTEKCPWRKKVMQGEVHDENAWSLGGVAPHAGLFGSIAATAQWGLWLRKAYYSGHPWLSQKTVEPFTRRTVPVVRGDWGLGFMLPTVGSASCGRYFSPKSIGHTGFTGTSFWFDPEKDLMVILLSNRIHPKRSNEEFRKWRPQIHDWVVECLSNEGVL